MISAVSIPSIADVQKELEVACNEIFTLPPFLEVEGRRKKNLLTTGAWADGTVYLYRERPESESECPDLERQPRRMQWVQRRVLLAMRESFADDHSYDEWDRRVGEHDWNWRMRMQEFELREIARKHDPDHFERIPKSKMVRKKDFVAAWDASSGCYADRVRQMAAKLHMGEMPIRNRLYKMGLRSRS